MTRAVLPASETYGTSRVPGGMVWGGCSVLMRPSFGNFKSLVVCRRLPLGKVLKIIRKTPGDQSEETWPSHTSGSSKQVGSLENEAMGCVKAGARSKHSDCNRQIDLSETGRF